MIVVFSHAHPSVSKGGAEVSAYTLYTGLRQMGLQAAFVAMVPEQDAARATFATPDEYVIPFRQDSYDHILHCGSPEMFGAAKDVLEPLQPTMLVFHHFLNLGINVVRDLVDHFQCPSAMVLHEFLAICHHHGQMVTHPQKRLCPASSPANCSNCFPQFSPEHFHLRKMLFNQTFSRMVRLISPSHFLAHRFIDWGISEEKLSVIENGLVGHQSPKTQVIGDEPQAGGVQPAANGKSGSSQAQSTRQRSTRGSSAVSAASQNSAGNGAKTKVFGYFGQINPFKGMDLLLDAIDILEERKVKGILLRIHGNVVGVSDEFRKRFERAAENSEFIDYQGPYNNADVIQLMEDCDYVVMASKWWENSPVVIQESFAAGRPLIVPDIGGMAEKVRNGQAGLHFKFGNAADLASVLSSATLDGKKYNLPSPLTAMEMAQAYIAVLPKH